MTKSVSRFDLMLVGTLMAALFACKGLHNKKQDDKASPGDLKASPTGTPLTLTWEQPYKLTTGTKAEATFFATHDADKPILKLDASFHGFPTGTKIRIGEEETTLGENAYHSTQLDLKSAILNSTLQDLKGPIELNLELQVEVPGAPPSKTKLPKQNLKESVRFALIKARDGGLSFGPNDSPADKPRSAAVVAGYTDLDFVGTGKTITDVDWVVYAEDQKEPRSTKQCAYKQGNSTLKIFDANVAVFDRRTGKLLKEKVLKADDACPMFAYVSKSDNSTKTSVMAKDVTAWARGEVK